MDPMCGEILRIDQDGNRAVETFDTSAIFERNYYSPHCSSFLFPPNRSTYQQGLIEEAKYYGIDGSDIKLLLDFGFDESDIKQMLYNLILFQTCLDTALYSGLY